ncbi:thiol-disulfide isomerase and thioredoxin [Photobacterium marinum]|uniref:Thiol-disulfide isomerase and thioredoxin n=1 Tax=Photobacterium marinum TaxID=1056511 RepID=L8J7Z3_9GAMM|nr:thioredoxin family protein [Photobacterium marinum]ELR64273.1 thiol-disulfide isomerase and thioredoxin [Photobacterium marinum]
MKTVKVLGSGCANCRNTADLIQDVADELNIEIKLEKVQDMAQIMAYQVMSTPAVVIDEQVVHKGSVPKRDVVTSWFA